MDNAERGRPNPHDFSQRAHYERLCEELNSETGPKPYSRTIPAAPAKTEPRH